VERKVQLSVSAPANIVKPIFTIHLPYGGKKSVLLTNSEQSVRTLLEPICKQRNMDINDYLAMGSDGKVLDMNTKLSKIDPREIILTGVNDVFTVYLPHGGKKSVILNPIQTLRSLLEKILNVRNMRLDEVVVLGSDEKPLEVDSPLGSIDDHCATLKPVDEIRCSFEEKEP